MNHLKKGEKTPGSGRSKGTPNKRTLDLQEKIDKLGLHPLEGLSKIIPDLESDAKAHVYLSLLPYLYPKRKAIEVSYDDETILKQIKLMEGVPTVELSKLIEESMLNGKSDIDL